MKLVATKQLKYATRRLLPGDVFEAKDRDARILIVSRKAREVRSEVELPPPPPALVEKVVADDLPTLRAEYERVLGKRAFMGWGADTLKEKIAAA